MDNQNSNAIQSDQQNPERDSTGETSLAKLSIEEDRGANSPAVSTNELLYGHNNRRQPSAAVGCGGNKTSLLLQHRSASSRESGAARRRLKKAKEGLAGETSKVTPSQIPKITSEVEGSQKKRAHTSDEVVSKPPTKGRFHRPGLTLQLANPRLRDNRGLSPVCVPSLSVNLTAHLTCDLTSFR